MTFPPHIQAAIDAGPLQSEQGKDEWTRRQLFASRIARMVVEWNDGDLAAARAELEEAVGFLQEAVSDAKGYGWQPTKRHPVHRFLANYGVRR